MAQNYSITLECAVFALGREIIYNRIIRIRRKSGFPSNFDGKLNGRSEIQETSVLGKLRRKFHIFLQFFDTKL